MNSFKTIHNKISDRIARRAVSVLLGLTFMLSAFMTGTYAWSSANQSALNEVMGNDKGFPVQLVKYERLADGTETTIPISGAEFYLYKTGTPSDIQIGDRFVTDENGKIDTKVKPGNYYFEETDPSHGFTYDTDASGAIKKYPFTVLGNETDIVTVTAYNCPIEGSLIITKTVKVSDGSAPPMAQLDTAFTFTVTFSDSGTYKYKINNGTQQSLTSGGTIQLRHGDSAVFSGIPVDTGYTVVETPVTGYVTSSENSSGDITEDGVTAAFTNTYTAPQFGSLTITKQVINTDSSPLTRAEQNKEFEFTDVIGGVPDTFILHAGETKAIDNIPVGTAYTVTEKDYSADGYTDTVHEYTGVVSAATQNITLPFVNVYGEESEKGSLTVSKTVVNSDGSALTQEQLDTAFTFNVTFAGIGAPDPATQTFTLKSGEHKTFDNVPAGVTYTVIETAADGYTPNFTAATGTIAGNQTAAVGYVNTYTAPQKTAIVIKKIGTGEGFDNNKEFSFTVYINGQPLPDKVTLKAGQQSDPIALNVGDTYSVVEDQTADYNRTSIINGSGTATTDTITVTQTNTYVGPVTVSISGEKIWDKQGQTVELPTQITVRLKNGNTVVASVVVKPDSNNKWTYTFDDVPKYDAQGKEIVYTVDEIPVAGWEAITDGYDITNTYVTPVTNTALPVQKIITGTPETVSVFKFILTALEGAPMPLGSASGVKTVTVNGAGSSDFGAITYTAAGTYTYTVAELNTGENGYTYDSTVYTYTVTVAEQNSKLAVTNKALTKNGQPVETAVFNNIYDADKTSIKVTKVWIDNNDPDRPDNVQAQLYKDGTASGDPVILNAANNWSNIWTGLDKSAAWTVDEINVPNGYAKTVSGDAVNGFTLTNTRSEIEKTSVTVSKVWNDNNNPDRPLNVQIQLYKDGNVYGSPVSLSTANNWTYTWAGLDKGPAYTVNEISVPGGYAKTITGDAATGFIVTNTKTVVPPDHTMITVSGKKTWDYGNSPENTRPTSIVVILKADGNIVLQKQITANENWSWDFTVPKYADDGHDIKYTIDEARINDYTKKISGYDLTNTYKPGQNTDIPDNGVPETNINPPYSPKTGDDSNMALWVVLMVGSAMGLIALAVVGRKQHKKYIPLH